MLCLQCGKEIGEGAKFCPHCGAMTAAAAPGPGFVSSGDGGAETPGYRYGRPQETVRPSGDPWDAAEPGGKKDGKKGLLVGGVVAAVAVVAALAVVLSGLFSSPKGQVEKAVAKTLSAYADTEKWLPDMAELTRSGSISQSFRVELNSINSELTGGYDLSALGGLGLSLSSDCDRERRRLGSELTAFWGENEIISIQMAADDNVLSFASPQLTRGDAYGVDTETLGADLARLGVEDEIISVEDIGFNLFDMMEQGTSAGGRDEDGAQAAKEAGKRLAKAVEVEKDGRREIEVNGKRVDAAAYRVVVPQEAVEEYMDAVEDVVKLADGQESVRQFLQAIGLGEDVIDQIVRGAAAEDSYGEVFDALEQMLQALGDLELDVYLDGGYVCAVEYSKQIDGETLEIGLYLGGGERYVDDFSLRIAVDGEEILVESNGSHSGKDGVFTDRTVFRVRSGGSTALRISSDFRYEPKALNGNFGWKLNVNNAVSVEMNGQLATGKDSVKLQLDDVILWAAGIKICSLAVDYSVGPCRGVEPSLPAPALLSDMDEGDLMELYYKVEENAQEWQYDMMGLIPEDLLYGLF